MTAVLPEQVTLIALQSLKSWISDRSLNYDRVLYDKVARAIKSSMGCKFRGSEAWCASVLQEEYLMNSLS